MICRSIPLRPLLSSEFYIEIVNRILTHKKTCFSSKKKDFSIFLLVITLVLNYDKVCFDPIQVFLIQMGKKKEFQNKS